MIKKTRKPLIIAYWPSLAKNGMRERMWKRMWARIPPYIHYKQQILWLKKKQDFERGFQMCMYEKHV